MTAEKRGAAISSSSCTAAAVIFRPGVCLALELLERGHRVSAAAPSIWWSSPARSASARCIRSAPTPTPRGRRTRPPTAEAGHRSPGSATRSRLFATGSPRSTSPLRRFVPSAMTAPLQDADLIVAAPLCRDRCLAVAEKLRIPLVVLRFGPMSENGVLGAVPGLTDSWSPEWKRRSWRLADRVTWLATGWNEASFRRRLGVPRVFGPLPKRLSALGVRQIPGLRSGDRARGGRGMGSGQAGRRVLRPRARAPGRARRMGW